MSTSLVISLLTLHTLVIRANSGEDTSTTTSTEEPTCAFRYLDDPVAAQAGDLVIGGFFQMSQLQENELGLEECSLSSVTQYGVQKAIALRDLVDRYSPQFKEKYNLTLGYEFYDTCGSSAVAGRASNRLIQNKNVVGVSTVDYKAFIKRSAAATTSFKLPTFSYIFNDEELMRGSDYPTLYSMIDTEVMEARVTIQMLRKMGYKYMDIWYHGYSEEMAQYIYEEYTKVEGCGRITEVSQLSHLYRINETYVRTGGRPSQVQLIMHNSISTVRGILTEMVEVLGFSDKIYITGLSNGRYKFLGDYTEILRGTNSTVILPLSDLLNTRLGGLEGRLQQDWGVTRDYIDDIYRAAQRRVCSESESCPVSSWIPLMVAGAQLLLERLYVLLSESGNEVEIACRKDFLKVLYEDIITEGRTTSLEMEQDFSLDIHMNKKTLNNGYQIGVWRTESETYGILGRAFQDKIVVENEALFQEISVYYKTCSATCSPGTHRRFGDNSQYLPCCWVCRRCLVNTISTSFNVDTCEPCNATAASNESRTGCVQVPEIYISSGSTKFIVGSAGAIFGVIMVIVFGVIIFMNKGRPVIKASDPGYLFMILLSALLGFPTGYFSLLKPCPSTCTAEYICGVFFATFLSTNLLYKSVKVYEIFAASKNFKKPKFGFLLKPSGQIVLNMVVIGVQSLLLLIDGFTHNGLTWQYRASQHAPHQPWHLICTSDGPYLILVMVLPSLAFLATLYLSFIMRKFPHNFRESLHIFSATFLVLLCCAMFLGGYQVSHALIRAMLRSVVLFVANIAFFLIIFVPKIVVLLRKGVDVEEERARIRNTLTGFSSSL